MAKKSNKRRADGLISIQVFLFRDEDGKRHVKTVYGKTQKEVEAKAIELKAALNKGIDVKSANDTFGKWASIWLKQKKLEVTEDWYTSCKSSIDHLSRYIGSTPITKIRTADIQRVVNDLADHNPNTGNSASRKLLDTVRGSARQIFDMAITNRLMDYNPANAVKIPKTKEAEDRRSLTEEEQGWIFNTDHRAKRAAMIMMLAGLRKGEAMALLWSDIDLEARTISVTKSVERVNGKAVVKAGAKTDAGVRVIDISNMLADYLAKEPRTSLFVCTNAQGDMHTFTSWRQMWESYLKEINFQHGEFNQFQKRPKSKFDPAGVPFVIPRFTAHWLRHTFCTLMYLAGIDILTAKQQMGHSDIKTTLAIYTHLDALHKRKAMSKMDEFLMESSNCQVSV